MGGKMTKSFIKVPVAGLVLLLFSFCVFAQNQTSSNIAQNSSEFSLSSNAPSGNSASGNDFDFNFTPQVANERAPSTFGLFIKMVVSLLIVLALVYLAVYLLKKSTKSPETDDPFLRNVAKISLGTGKSVQFATLLDHAYIVGVSENSVTPIAQIDDKELVDSLNLYSDKNSSVSKPRSFADVLDIFMPHGPRDNSVFDDSARNASEQLKRRRERFNSGNQGGFE